MGCYARFVYVSINEQTFAMTKDYFKNPALGAFLSDLQEIIFVNGKRLSYKSICQDAKLTK